MDATKRRHDHGLHALLHDMAVRTKASRRFGRFCFSPDLPGRQHAHRARIPHRFVFDRQISGKPSCFLLRQCALPFHPAAGVPHRADRRRSCLFRLGRSPRFCLRGDHKYERLSSFTKRTNVINAAIAWCRCGVLAAREHTIDGNLQDRVGVLAKRPRAFRVTVDSPVGKGFSWTTASETPDELEDIFRFSSMELRRREDVSGLGGWSTSALFHEAKPHHLSVSTILPWRWETQA
ncbi:hypothetical protein BJ546DRAFT_60402 [Cryomyces antarcticus]